PCTTHTRLNLARSGNDRREYVVSTSIALGEAAAHVQLDLWDVATGERADELTDEVPLEGVAPALVEVGRRLAERLPELGKLTRAAPEHPLAPGGALLDGYTAV